MSAIIVDDQMEIETSRCLGVYFLQESNELLVTMARHAVADHRAVERAESRKQGCGAVAFVIVSDRSQAPFLQWEAWLGAIQCLNLAFFVDRENQGFVRRVEVEPNNVDQFFEELFVSTQFEGFNKMGFEIVLLPYAAYRCFAQPLCFGHGSCTPVRRIRRSRMQRCLDHSFDLARRDSRNPSRAGSVFFQSGTPERQEPPAPQLNCRSRNAQTKSDDVVEHSGSRHLDDASALHQAQRDTFPARPQPDGLLFVGRQDNGFCRIHRA